MAVFDPSACPIGQSYLLESGVTADGLWGSVYSGVLDINLEIVHAPSSVGFGFPYDRWDLSFLVGDIRVSYQANPVTGSSNVLAFRVDILDGQNTQTPHVSAWNSPLGGLPVFLDMKISNQFKSMHPTFGEVLNGTLNARFYSSDGTSHTVEMSGVLTKTTTLLTRTSTVSGWPYPTINSIYIVGQNLPNECGNVNINFTADDTLVSVGETVNFTDLSTGLPAEGLLYSWLANGVEFATVQDPSWMPTAQGVYTIEEKVSVPVESSDPAACPLGESYLAKGAGAGYDPFVLFDFNPPTGVIINGDGSADISGAGGSVSVDLATSRKAKTVLTIASDGTISGFVLCVYSISNTGGFANIDVSLNKLASETGWRVSYRGTNYTTPRYLEWSAAGIEFIATVEIEVSDTDLVTVKGVFSAEGITEEINFDFQELSPTHVFESSYNWRAGEVTSIYAIGTGLASACAGIEYTDFSEIKQSYITVIGEAPCRSHGFILEGFKIPYNRDNYDYQLNERHISFTLNSGDADIRHRELEYGDTVKIETILTYYQATTLLRIIMSKRGGDYNVTLPTNYFMFGHRYGATVICRLADSSVSYKDNGRDNIAFSLELQIVGEVV